MTKKSSIKLMTKESKVMIRESDALQCYGLSKMTVADEITHAKKYDKLELVEFAEYIGRVANFKYKDTLEFDLS